ncbi:MAG: LptF/LptG family permease, partial [Planctomycetales bacterium]
MPRIIDRYFVWEYAKIFLICFSSLVGLFVVFHAFSKLDKFMAWTDSTDELLRVMAEFYMYRVVLF